VADILDLAAARAALRLPAADTSPNADLTATYIPAVTAIVEDIAGPQTNYTGLTWIADGGSSTIMLPTAVTAVTEVVESDQTLTSNDYVVDMDTGILTRGSTLAPSVWAPGVQNVEVTYNAVVTARKNVVLAARIILAHLYQSDQQGARPEFGSNEVEVVQTPSGFAIPRRAYELLKPDPDVPGFA
jgi:hypothetical protein